jgi:hypothetical protein
MKSLMRATCFLSLRQPDGRTLLCTILLCLCSVRIPAQSIEGQIVASQLYAAGSVNTLTIEPGAGCTIWQ